MRTVSAAVARVALEALSPTQLSAPDDLGTPLDYDPGFTWPEVVEVRERLLTLAHDCGLPSTNKAKAGPFDAEASVILHAGLRATPQAIADDGLWRYLCLAPFGEIVQRRHPWNSPKESELGVPPKPKEANYGLAGRFNGLILRLWLRGDIGSDEDYRYARAGDVDLWRSHLLRVEMGAIRPLAKALIVESGWTGERERLSTEEIRKLVKNLRACQAFVCAELMDEAEARRFVRGEIDRTMT